MPIKNKTGEWAQAADVNSIFTRLEALRQKHYDAAGQTETGKNALGEAEWNQAPAVQHAMVEEPYTLMKTYLNALRQSAFLTNLTEEEINKIITPSAGDLIEFANLDVSDDILTNIENISAGYSANFSSFNSDNYSGYYANNFSNFNTFSSSFDTSDGSSFSGCSMGNIGFNVSAFNSSNFTTNSSGFNSSSFNGSSFNGSSFNSSSFNSSSFSVKNLSTHMDMENSSKHLNFGTAFTS